MKKIISKRSYYVSSAIFHAFCISGLVWQVTNISSNFFMFDTIKDINVFMPEQVNNTNRVLYVCYDILDMINIEAWKEISKTSFRRSLDIKIYNMAPGEIFNTTFDFDSIVSYGGRSNRFLIDRFICYQSENPTHIIFKSTSLEYPIAVSLGERLPFYDYRRPYYINDLDMVVNGTISKMYWINSCVYDYKRLGSPYTDRCRRYRNSKNEDIDQLISIAKCTKHILLNRTNGTVSSKLDIIDSSNAWRYNFKYFHSQTHQTLIFENQIKPYCESLYRNPDCIKRVYLTKIATRNIRYFYPSLHFSIRKDTEPSMFIESKPRIDNIDFVTYILGALGSWIGFSFIAINPVSYFFNIETSDEQITTAPPTDISENCLCNSNLIENLLHNQRYMDNCLRHLTKRVYSHDCIFERNKSLVLPSRPLKLNHGFSLAAKNYPSR